MKRKNILIICLVLIILVGIVIALTVYSNLPSVKIRKQLDLGNKYLVSLEYDEAIAEFNRVISINPLNVDAYIGLADAYIGKGDYDNAISVLQSGINCLSENGESTGAAILQDKLDQIQSIYTQNYEEPDVKIVDNEPEENNELPIIRLKPIVDAAAPYGIPASDWSIEKLVEHDGLELLDDGISPFYSDSYDGSESAVKHIARLNEEDGFTPRPGTYAWSVENSENLWSECMWFTVSKDNNQYYFWQNTEDDHLLYEYVAKLFDEEGITDVYSLMSFIGLSESQAEYIISASDVGQERIEIATDYGKGSIAANIYENADRLYEFYMEINVSENKEHGHLKSIEYKKDKDGNAQVVVFFYRK